MVQDTVNHHPLHLDPKAVVLLLHPSIGGVFLLPLVALLLLSIAAEVYGWGFVHVVLALVVSEHHLTVHLQLERVREDAGQD